MALSVKEYCEAYAVALIPVLDAGSPTVRFSMPDWPIEENYDVNTAPESSDEDEDEGDGYEEDDDE